MSVYAINYDLKQPGRDYKSLHEAIRSYGTWCHALDSLWFISTTQSAAQVRDYLALHLDPNDALMVAKQSGEAAWRGLDAKQSKWLQDALNAVTRV